MNKLTNLSIDHFRNVVPTTLVFRPGINVLLGKNAAGKTTLLRLLSTAIGIQEQSLADDVFHLTYRVSGRSLDFKHTIVRTREEPDPFVGLTGDFPSIRQVDEFAFWIGGRQVADAVVTPGRVDITREGNSVGISLPSSMAPIPALMKALTGDEDDVALMELASAIMLGRIKSAGRMDESLERLEKLLNLEIKRQGTRTQLSFAEVPRGLHARLTGLGPTIDGTSVSFSLPFLERVARVLRYDFAKAHFDVDHPATGMVRLSKLRFFWGGPGEEISHDLLSYGQKRLLAFFAHVDASPDVVIADELVNGLHHGWIKACLEEIGDRQAFLTSQNPLLLDFLRFDSAEEVRNAFILCERVPRFQGERLNWRNPTEEEAESFFAAYQTGIQRVSDILLTKGFW